MVLLYPQDEASMSTIAPADGNQCVTPAAQPVYYLSVPPPAIPLDGNQRVILIPATTQPVYYISVPPPVSYYVSIPLPATPVDGNLHVTPVATQPFCTSSRNTTRTIGTQTIPCTRNKGNCTCTILPNLAVYYQRFKHI